MNEFECDRGNTVQLTGATLSANTVNTVQLTGATLNH